MKDTDITLPRRNNGMEASVLPPCRHFVIIGANGAGKTRFTDALAASLGKRAFRLSALEAIYGRRSDAPWSLRGRLSPTVVSQAEKNNPAASMLDILLAQLMHDEMVNLIGYKLAVADGRDAALRPTRLDAVIALWQDIFPESRVLIDSGKPLFTRGFDMSAYSSLRLSDGERAVLYYAGAILYAPKGGVVLVDSPEIFLHPTLRVSLWNRLEQLRSDCIFAYMTHDTDFASSRTGAPVVWVRDYDASSESWSYDILPADAGLSPELYMTLVGSRKPVLFIEGDSEHSIDAKLYPFIFPDFTVQPLGSCNKVIEATRTFNDLASFHRMDSSGIVDRDRRDDAEVAYLRRKKIMVPEVAEIENMLLLEDVVKAMAEASGHNADRVFGKVRKAVLSLFRADLRQQALMHTRHRMKRTLEYRIDARCRDIGSLEHHLTDLVSELDPRRTYEEYCRRFHILDDSGDYAGVLKVFNQKSILTSCNVAQLCGFKSREQYIEGIMDVLEHNRQQANVIRAAVRECLKADAESEK